jgi:hypothetical protein
MNDKTKTAEPITADFTEEVHEGSRDLATRDPAATAVAPADLATFTATSMMSMVRELALDERIDAAKLETVMRVANQQQDREREIQFYQDKNRAVRDMPMIRKDGRIVILDKAHPEDMSKARVQGHFEKWPDVQAAITPVLDRYHLTLTHKIDHADGQTVVIAVLTHDNGYREESGPMRLPLDTSGGKNNVQGAGSSQTYGMRYTARAICGLKLVGGQQDDDGNLTAMPDEPLNDQQQRRVEEAERAFARGKEAYEEWFSGIPAIDRAWMVQSGRHAEFGGMALPGALPKPKNDAPRQQEQRQPDTNTPEGWTEQYEIDCREAQTLDELAGVQQRGAKAMERLKAGNHKALHDRAIKAGSDAYARLSGQDESGDEGEQG